MNHDDFGFIVIAVTGVALGLAGVIFVMVLATL